MGQTDERENMRKVGPAMRYIRDKHLAKIYTEQRPNKVPNSVMSHSTPTLSKLVRVVEQCVRLVAESVC